MKENNLFKKILISLLCICILFLIFFMWSKNKSVSIYLGINEGNTVGEITSGRKIEQTFIVSENGLNGVDVLLATYARQNNCNVTIELYDVSNDYLVCTTTVLGNQIQDNRLYPLRFETISNSKNNMYKIVISTDAQSGNGITAWSSFNDSYPEGILCINDKKMEGDISFRICFNEFFLCVKEIKEATLFALVIGISLMLIGYKVYRYKNYIFMFAFAIMFTWLAGVFVGFVNANILEVVTAFSERSYLCMIIVSPVTFLISALIWFDKEQVITFIFKKRWILAGVIFILFFANKLTFSNVAYFDNYIQPGIKTEYSKPLIGEARAIRSDEWLVSVSRKASAEYSDYGQYNYLMRGTENYNITTGLYKSYSALANPFNLGYYLFGNEYGNSFYWCALVIFMFMISFEWSLILAKGNKLIALFGAIIISLSSWNLWWSINIHLVAMQAAFVCVFYYFRSKNKYVKAVLAFSTALSGALFVTNLYPAWQVPMVYIIIGIIAWIILNHKTELMQLKKNDWLIITLAFVFMVSIIISYMYDNGNYMDAVMQTVYPGKRISTGGYAIEKLMYYVQSLLYPWKDYGNPSEAGVFFNLFPLPLIFSFYLFIRQMWDIIRKKKTKIDWMNIILLIPSLVLLTYCTVGFPTWLSKLTLLSYSPATRAVDILGILCTYLLIYQLAQEGSERKINFFIGSILSLLVVGYAITISEKVAENYLTEVYIGYISVCLFALCITLMCEVSNKQKLISISAIMLVVGMSGLSVLPISKGMDALKEKPVAKVIQKIAEENPNAKWCSYNSMILGNYIIANGGSSLTSTNYLPNIELWEELDSENKYEDVYNRYAHVFMMFSDKDTSFELVTPDAMRIYLSYEDMEKCDISYILSESALVENSEVVDFELLYQESNIYIYEVMY